MRKIWIPLLAVVVLAAAWLGASWYSGKRTEALIDGGIAHLNEIWSKSDPRLGLRLKPVSYQRGLLTTHARYALTSSLLPDEQMPKIDVTIWHGPLPHGLTPKRLALHAELALTGMAKQVMDSLMHGKPPLAMDAACGYDGLCTGTGQIPAVDLDKIKLAFGGVQMRYDVNWRSETDYQAHLDMQVLPLSIGGQDFGSGHWVAASSAQDASQTLSWKTSQGESKLTLALALTRPVSSAETVTLKPEDRLSFIASVLKTVSLNAALSKPMLIDLGASAAHVVQGADEIAARQQVEMQLNDALTGNPMASQFIRVDGDTISSDWQYAGGKLTVNGQEHPEMLERIQKLFQLALQAQHDAAGLGDNP